MNSFLRRLKGVGHLGAEEAAIALRAEKTGLKVFDDVMEIIPIRNNEFGNLKIGEMHVGEFNKVVRHGDLAQLLRLNNVKVPFTSVDESMFRDSMLKTAEHRSYNIEKLSNNVKKSYPQLDVYLKDIDNMTPATKADIARLEKNATSRMGSRVRLALYIGVATLSAGWMINNWRSRRGCKMSTNINGVITSCHVHSFTCLAPIVSSSSSGASQVCNEGAINDSNYYNITLVLIHLSNLNDADANDVITPQQPQPSLTTLELKQMVCAAANVQPKDMKRDLALIIDTKYKEVSDVIMANREKIPRISPCTESHKAVENGKIPICRMCSPSANPMSTMYLDPSQYADNVTFECVENPSFIDVVSDFMTTTGSNILSGISSTLWALTKPLLYIIGAAVVLLALVLIGFSMFKSYQQNKAIQPTSSDRRPLLQNQYLSEANDDLISFDEN